MVTQPNTRKKENKPKSASAIEREIAALTRLLNAGHLDAAQHKERYDAILSFDDFCDQDITSNRHRGNQESREAFAKASLSVQDNHRAILRLYDRNGGMTAKEIAQSLGRQLNTISGRISELRAGQYLEPAGLRREGSAVLKRTRKEWQ